MDDFLSGQFKVAKDNRIEAPSPEPTSIVGNLATPSKSRARPITLLIVCGIVLVAAIAIGTLMTILKLHDRELAQSERELSNIAMLVARHSGQEIQELELVQNSIIERIQSFGIVSSEDFQRKMSGQEVHLMLKDKVSGLSHVAYVSLVDAKGNMINFSGRWPVPAINVADRSYFQKHKSDAQLAWFVSEPIRNRVTGTWVINLSRKFTAPNGEFLGLIGGAIELQYFERFFGAVALGEGSAIALFHSDGVLLARYPRVDALIGRSFSANALFPKLLEHSDHGVGRQKIGVIAGEDRLVAAHRIAHYPVVVVVTTTVAAALAHWRDEAILLVGAAGLAAFLIAVVVFVIVRQLLQGKKLFQQEFGGKKLQLDTALNNMSQGLCMFDSSKRIVICNRQYLEMYRMSPEVAKPGCTIHEIIRYRKEIGSFSGDVEQYCAELDAAIAQGTTTSNVVETNGRSIHIVNQPVAGGGWVATHEDITEQRRAERNLQQSEKELRTQNQRFDAALNNMAHGLVMYDPAYRIAVCNRQYIEMYGLSLEVVKPGCEFRELIEHRKARGSFNGDVDEYCARILAGVATGNILDHVTETPDGRTIHIINRPMENGGRVSMHLDITERRRMEAEIIEQNARFDAALQNMSQGLAMFDRDRNLIVCNQRYAELYKLPPELIKPGITQKQILEYRVAMGAYAGPNPEQYVRDRIAIAAEEKPSDTVIELSDGRIVAVVHRPTIDGGWVSTHEDITQRRRAEQERDRNREFLDLIIENVPSTIVVKDARDFRYVLINQAGEEYYGIPRDQMIGKTAQDVLPKGAADLVTRLDKQVLQTRGRPVVDEHQLETPGHGTRIVMSKRLPILDESGKPQYLLAVVDDITERKQAEARIAHMAHYDALTDLPNRVLLRERLEQELSYVQRGGQLAVLHLDLDHFKGINDTLGHSTGDELLKAAADRLRGCLRDNDIMARLGGDEFAIVQIGLEKPIDAAILAQRLRDVTQKPYELNGHQVVVDVSIGIALSPNDGTDADQLLKSADMALSGAKSEGRGSYRYFEPEMDARMKTRRTLEVDLRKALINGEFELHYQPLVNLQNNEVSGCEALLRWHHPERGMISPAEFIPVAEEMGLIISIGEWVLRQACAEAATWPDGVKVAVNLSPAQFKKQALTQVVISTLAASGLPPHRLELEITESVLLQNNEATFGMLHQLRELGVRIAMDDFGTGYSSLSYLRSFPFDKIKIDRCFINDLSKKVDSLAIVRAVVGLASSLNMVTTAEGVETQQQMEIVKALGCTEMQGYFFSPPKPAAEISRLFLPRADRAASAA